MAEQEYFKSALSDFTYEAASGGAIRHLADLGYTVKQISGQLSFPTPYGRVQKTVWQRLLETGILLAEEPGSGKRRSGGRAEYVMERDKYGRTSFRLAAAKDGREKAGEICWKERKFGEGGGSGRGLAVYLADKYKENNGEAYISCSFGLLLRKEPAAVETVLAALNERQREYITGLPWEEKLCYHRLDQRMQEIAVKLYHAGKLRETCFFMKTGEKVTVEPQGRSGAEVDGMLS